jgi:hypothetical protein
LAKSNKNAGGGLNQSEKQSYIERIAMQKELIAGQVEQVDKAKELFQVLREIKNDQKGGYGYLTDDLKKQLKLVTEILQQNEQNVKNLEALEKAQQKVDKAEKQRLKNARELLHSNKDLDTTLTSISNTVGKQSKLYEVNQAHMKSMHVTMNSIGQVMSGLGKNQKELKKEVLKSTDAYKSVFSNVAKAGLELKKHKIDQREYNKIVKDSVGSFEDMLASMKFTGKEGKKLKAILQAALKEQQGFAAAAEKTEKHFEAMDQALGQLSSSGIPLMGELGKAIEQVATKGTAIKASFAALGAAIGVLLAKTLPGVAEWSAKQQAINDKLQATIDLNRELGRLGTERSFIPQKIELERMQNSIETLNNMNRASIEADYSRERAIKQFSATVQSAAAEFRAASKTALFGDKLGGVGYGAAQLQMAGISAETIATALGDASREMGRMPAQKVAEDMAVLSKRTGQSTTDLSSINDMFVRMDGLSESVALNMQEGLRVMAKQSHLNLGNLMQTMAAASKDALSYQIKSGKELAKQVAYAQSLGVDFNGIAKAGRSMVTNYKDSIKGEMQLSAMLGRNVDLSDVRQLFYEGKNDEAMKALKSKGLNPAEMDAFQQDALQSALQGIDLTSIQKMTQRTGANVTGLAAGNAAGANKGFLARNQSAQQTLSADQAQISAKQAIVDAELSGKITDAYLKSAGYLDYQNSLNEQSVAQTKLNTAIDQAFMSTQAYITAIAEAARLDVRRGFTENLAGTAGGILGGLGGLGVGSLLTRGKGGTGGTTGAASMFSKAAPGASVAFGNVAGAGMGSNIASAAKSGGAITGGIVSGIASGVSEWSENSKLGMSVGQNIGRTTVKAVSSGVGGWGGASIGAAIGTAIFPGVGTVIGGLLGGWLGSKGGDALGGAINNGIWGDKQNQQLRVQETMQQAQERLKQETAQGIKVDAEYYRRALKLDQEQVKGLQNYNQKALDPEWLKNPPAWYLKSGGRDTTGETYTGSGMRLLSGTYKGDKEAGKYGLSVGYKRDKDGNIKSEVHALTADEYIKGFFEETGKKLTKAALDKMVSAAGATDYKYSADAPIVKNAITAGAASTPEQAVDLYIKNTKDPDWLNKSMKSMSDKLAEDMKQIGINQGQITDGVTKGLNKAELTFNSKYERSPSIGMTLDKDNSGIFNLMQFSLDKIANILTFQSTQLTKDGLTNFQATLDLNRKFNDLTKSNSSSRFKLGFGGSMNQQFAKGTGPMGAPGGLALVGEKGPELINLPKGTDVVPNHKLNMIPGFEHGTPGAVNKVTAGHGTATGHGGGEHHGNGLDNFNYLAATNTILSGFGPLALAHFAAHPFEHEAPTKLQKEKQSHNESFAALEMMRLLNPIKHGKVALKNVELLHKAHNWYKTYKETRVAFQLGKALSVGAGMSKLKYGLTAAAELAPGYAKYLGKGLLQEAASVPVAVLGTLYSLQSASNMLDNTNISASGKEASTGRKAGNFTMGVGASMYDVINDWVTVGLLDKFVGQKTGLTYPGASGTETATMRAAFFNSNPTHGQSLVSNDELTGWAMANASYVKGVLGEDTFGLMEKYAKEHKISGKSYEAEAKKNKVTAAIAKKKRVETAKKTDASQQKAFTFNTMHLDQPGTNLSSKYGPMLAMQDKKKASITPTKKYANGTNFASGGLSLIGERGPELMNIPRAAQVIPNNKIGSTMDKIQSNTTNQNSGVASSNSTQTIILKVDGKTLSTVVNSYNENTTAMRPDSKFTRRR